jgi:hypothetical protein
MAAAEQTNHSKTLSSRKHWQNIHAMYCVVITGTSFNQDKLEVQMRATDIQFRFFFIDPRGAE